MQTNENRLSDGTHVRWFGNPDLWPQLKAYIERQQSQIAHGWQAVSAFLSQRPR